MEAADRQAGNKVRALVWQDDAHTIWLILVARQLGDKFVVTYARTGG